ncbi:hemagglutinin/amebocyte aggregation factor-like [Dendronephthya gigantea]|uniref:hemagglutinin/amebocyte aggregation factor-like n=1 Tax=Dendronephthya gigantea TaxID=151771 RepID=UPI00106CBEF7|nr:hemagglutinin/amebocyte aggregation factor-like [Dendronephthya gigantea]
MKVMLAFLLLLVHAMSIMAGTNFDGEWTIQCPAGQSIYHVSSVHSNHHEDRSWTFTCRANSKITNNCQWSGFVNSYDHEIIYQCPSGLISGVHSRHSNHHEDRQFNYKCCRTTSNALRHCSWTGYVNNWDAYMNYHAPWNKFLVGMNSHHNNGKEDRIWRFLVCGIA